MLDHPWAFRFMLGLILAAVWFAIRAGAATRRMKSQFSERPSGMQSAERQSPSVIIRDAPATLRAPYAIEISPRSADEFWTRPLVFLPKGFTALGEEIAIARVGGQGGMWRMMNAEPKEWDAFDYFEVKDTITNQQCIFILCRDEMPRTFLLRIVEKGEQWTFDLDPIAQRYIPQTPPKLI